MKTLNIDAEPGQIAIDPARTAIVMIDMQRDFLEPGGFGETLGNDVSLLTKAVKPAKALLGWARKLGMLIVHTREGHRPDMADAPPAKVERARANFESAGLASFIDLREGDIVEAAKTFEGPIDFVLFDIWSHVVRPMLDVLLPRLRPGAVLGTDGGGNRSGGYEAMFELIDDPASGFRTMTLPFKGGGLELTLKL